MGRTSWTELKTKQLTSMTEAERQEYDVAYAAAALATSVLMASTTNGESFAWATHRSSSLRSKG
jgi:hypothetical protein